MRLLNSRTLTFEEFDRDSSAPPYAVLSHTWGEEEVTYKDMRKRRAIAESKEGFRKINFCAQQAREEELNFIWVDTCCIDKSSSAELSEAINSMFRWYQNAAVCYTYLSDTPAQPAQGSSESGDVWTRRFQTAHWFTRGWTLQELIAPKSLVFYSQEWSKIGTKEDLAIKIEACTGVPLDVLVNRDLSSSSVAQKMSWAAQRSTSRTEDIAYCLMGLFDVHMPMLYGEGEWAFIRLQEEIIRSSDDMSIFSWVDRDASFSTFRGLLAKSPAGFAQCKDVCWARSKSNPPYQITNKGIKMDSRLNPRATKPNEFVAPLWGVANSRIRWVTIGIYLKKVGEDQFARIEPEQLALVPPSTIGASSGPLTTFFVRQNVVLETMDHARAAGISLRLKPSTLSLVEVQPSERWSEEDNFFSFGQPATAQKPPQAVFSLKSALGSRAITITIDAGKNWGHFVAVSGGWKTAERKTSSTHRVHCRNPLEPMIEIIVQRGLFNDELKILLSIKVELSSRSGFEHVTTIT